MIKKVFFMEVLLTLGYMTDFYNLFSKKHQLNYMDLKIQKYLVISDP